MSEKALFNLSFENCTFAKCFDKILSADSQAFHLAKSPVDKAVSLRIADVEPTDVGTHAKSDLVELAVVDFKPNFVVALFHEKDL